MVEHGGQVLSMTAIEPKRTTSTNISSCQKWVQTVTDTEVYVDATTEDGMGFCFQYTKKMDPVYALEPTKKWPEGRKWSGATWVHTMDRLDFPICAARAKPCALMDSGASHMLLPLSMLMGKDLEEASRIQLNLAVGQRRAMFRDEVYAEGKHGGELWCSDGKKTHLLMQFSTMGTMQYVSEDQFAPQRKALWTSAIKSVPNYDAEFWRESCYASITFTFDGEENSSESSVETVSDIVEYVSDVLIGRCEIATAACKELEALLDSETIPSGSRWDNARSLLVGAYTRQGVGISKYTEPKSHWLLALHALAKRHPPSIVSKVKMEYTSIQINKVGWHIRPVGSTKWDRYSTWDAIGSSQWSDIREEDCGSNVRRASIPLRICPLLLYEESSMTPDTSGSCSIRRLHALEHDHWDQLAKFGFPCKHLTRIYRNFQLSHVCCNAWFKDLDEAVPEKVMPSLADVTQEWERHHRQGRLTKLPSCPAWQRESGPWIVHRRTKATERKIGVLMATWRTWDRDCISSYGHSVLLSIDFQVIRSSSDMRFRSHHGPSTPTRTLNTSLWPYLSNTCVAEPTCRFEVD
eukprot:1343039-Amphidinium_carterae.2